MEELFGQFSLGLFILQFVLFVALVFLLKKFAWKPILDAVNEREDGIKNALLSAENAKKEMQNLKSDNEKLLADARLERDAMMKDAREIKEKMINDAKTEAQVAGEKMIAQAKAAIESEKNAAMAELKAQVSNLSLDIAEKVLKSELSNKESQTKLVEKMLGDVKLN
ncbi:MAG TPA: F0F1 ATP synthase subunit B [Flavobacterium sp.]|jgi:F-type H+-transporting ATPase subunit b|uniref:F0F1 ATP synthase subunit B n=1 Tax=Flavobacterium sp. TaxID=239 RepID=UPI002B6BD5E4|nr:F0F1 ATP synthase subunit B [Flavobacterium sp.]MCA0348408.1 F0F1 ATP synthase subunit B [Bacteroidota bacterium]HPW97468.1 F0F1 ATP synthase subunit B [Flavobacterium sp.]HQA73041.1 F0F1 ATP synthase subunit B [Flavobacterium sp.]